MSPLVSTLQGYRSTMMPTSPDIISACQKCFSLQYICSRSHAIITVPTTSKPSHTKETKNVHEPKQFFALHTDIWYVCRPEFGSCSGETVYVTVHINLNEKVKGGSTGLLCRTRCSCSYKHKLNYLQTLFTQILEGDKCMRLDHNKVS